ncbi:hypothetical protein H1R20_g1425, partial [Candolleomyces eurysporus]
MRYITWHKSRNVSVIEAEATDVDPTNKMVTFTDDSEIKGATSSTSIKYDYLVYAVSAEVQTFNIPRVKEHAVFMKELQDAEQMQHGDEIGAAELRNTHTKHQPQPVYKPCMVTRCESQAARKSKCEFVGVIE